MIKFNHIYGQPIGLLFYEDGGYVLRDINGILLPIDITNNITKSTISSGEYTELLKDSNTNLNSYYNNMTNIDNTEKNKTCGHIYAVSVGDKIKIGKSKNILSRLNIYKKGFNNYRLICLIKSDDIDNDEKEILNIFGGKPSVNEWFDWNKELEDKINRVFNKYENKKYNWRKKC